MKSLLVALGLDANAAEHTALTAVTALQGKADSLQTQLAAAQANAFDTTKHVPMVEYQRVTGELTALSAQSAAAELTALTDKLIGEGKLTAGQKPWALDMDLKGLQAFAATAVANPALAGGKQDVAGNAGAGAGASDVVTALSAEQMVFCKTNGIDPAAFLVTLNKTPSVAA